MWQQQPLWQVWVAGDRVCCWTGWHPPEQQHYDQAGAPEHRIYSSSALQTAIARPLASLPHLPTPSAEASWHIAGEVGMQPIQVARMLAAPVVAAVDSGRAAAVAAVQRLLFGARMQPLLVWLLVEMIEGMDRPGAAAAAALEGLNEEGGAGVQQGRFDSQWQCAVGRVASCQLQHSPSISHTSMRAARTSGFDAALRSRTLSLQS